MIKGTKMFNVHHSPLGAWASLTFGSPLSGVSIDLEEPEVKKSGTMLFGIASDKEVRSIGFTERVKHNNLSSDRENPPVQDVFNNYGIYPEQMVRRSLTPSCDTFEAENLSLTVYTPPTFLDDIREREISPVECVPGILMDFTIDNRNGNNDLVAFFCLSYYQPKKIYSFVNDKTLGFGFKEKWTFAVKNNSDAFLIQGGEALDFVKRGIPFLHQNGPAYICTKVPAGEMKTLSLCWSVFTESGSIGNIISKYYYTKYFSNVYDVANCVLSESDVLRKMCREYDDKIMACVACDSNNRVEIFSQAVRGYYASSQLLIDEKSCLHWNVSEGAYLWRNTIDLCADHLAWELFANPWIVRNLMDDFINHYSYHDRVYFPGKDGDYAGGLSFTHDMGCYFTYSERGKSAYERENNNSDPFYCYMTTEELLNGIYCICGYTLKTNDVAWLNSHSGILGELMDSLENRDGMCDSERNGILKGVSCRSGSCGIESTTYDALDHSLLEAAGNIYVFIKTWCSLVMLKKCAKLLLDDNTAKRAEAMLEKCRMSVDLFKNNTDRYLKSNVYKDFGGAVSAAAEPLAIPYLLGAINESDEPILFETLKNHEDACLEKGVCIDENTGGLRLSSTSTNSWTSKVILTLFVLENALKMHVPESIERELLHWTQVSAAELTVSDQIRNDTRVAIGGHYYPRIVTAAVWLWGK